MDEIWDNLIGDIHQSYLEKFRNNEKFNLAGIEILSDRIQFDKIEILIKDLEIKTYKHHFIIYSINDQYKNKMLYYLKDKDAVILLDILTKIF